MRAITFLFLFAFSYAAADILPNSRPLDSKDKAQLLRHAAETCGGTPVEVSGWSYEIPEEDKWEANALVYFTPSKSAANLCKSRICEYAATKPKVRAPIDFSWGTPIAVDSYAVWPAQNGQCFGVPSAKIAVIHPIEENTLSSLIERRHHLAEEGRAWLRKHHPDASLLLDDVTGELESISVGDDFGTARYWLVYGGAKGLLVRVGTHEGKFVVHEAGAPPRP